MILPGGLLNSGAWDTTQMTVPKPETKGKKGTKAHTPGKAQAPVPQKHQSYHHSGLRQKATATRAQNLPQRNGPHQKVPAKPPEKATHIRIGPGDPPMQQAELTEGAPIPPHP